MHHISEARPATIVEPVTDIHHGVSVIDPYRWLEEAHSPRTRKWIEEQTLYAHAYFERIPGRDRVRARITELLSVDTCEIPHKVGDRYFFRKRTAKQEQPCIYMRNGASGEDILLLDPSTFESGRYTSVSISQVSPDGRFLLYEIKQGGE